MFNLLLFGQRMGLKSGLWFIYETMHAPIFGLMNAWLRIIILDFQEFGKASEPLASQVLTIYFHVGNISLNLPAQKTFHTTLKWNGGSIPIIGM